MGIRIRHDFLHFTSTQISQLEGSFMHDLQSKGEGIHMNVTAGGVFRVTDEVCMLLRVEWSDLLEVQSRSPGSTLLP
jgi:hypothetical protein